MKRLFPLVLIWVFLMACTAETAVEPTVTAVPTPTTLIIPAAESPTSVPVSPSPTAVAVQIEPTSLPEPTAAPPTAVPEPVIVYGRTPEGAFFHGAVDAPITLIDYSDFL